MILFSLIDSRLNLHSTLGLHAVLHPILLSLLGMHIHSSTAGYASSKLAEAALILPQRLLTKLDCLRLLVHHIQLR